MPSLPMRPPVMTMRSPTSARFSCPGRPCSMRRHQRRGAAVDQRLAGEALVEDDRAVDGRDAALVAAVLDPLDHPFEDPPRMEQPRRQRLVVEGRGEAEDVGVEDQLRAATGAEGVAVDADDAGQRAAVGIEGGGRVVGLDLEDQGPVVGEADHPGVVLEDREAEVPLPLGGAHVAGGADDEGLEQRVDGLLLPLPRRCTRFWPRRSCACSARSRSAPALRVRRR